ncbi:MAG: class I SAM-dependent methyltransferase [Candidatus Aenigmatarchaeota archaeon]
MNLLIIFLLFFLLYFWVRLILDEAIYIPLPKSTIRKMLKLAKVSKKDLLYDLGAGDGRVVIIAAKEFGCKAVGIERSALLAAICRWRIKRAGLQDKIKIIEKNYFDVNLSKAAVITAYLSKKQNEKLVPKLKKELKKGTRVVSASHIFPGLKEVKRIKTGHFYSYLYKI